MDFSSLIGSALPGTEEERKSLEKANDYLCTKYVIGEVNDSRFKEYLALPWDAYLSEMRKVAKELSESEKLEAKELRILACFGFIKSEEIFPDIKVTPEEAKNLIIELVNSPDAFIFPREIEKEVGPKVIENLETLLDDDTVMKYGKAIIYQKELTLRVMIAKEKYDLLDNFKLIRFHEPYIYFGMPIEELQVLRRFINLKNLLADTLTLLFMELDLYLELVFLRIASIRKKVIDPNNTDGNTEEGEKDEVKLVDVYRFKDDFDPSWIEDEKNRKFFLRMLGYYNISPEQLGETLINLWDETTKRKQNLISGRNDKAGIYEIKLPFALDKKAMAQFADKINEKFGKKIVVETEKIEDESLPWLVLNDKEAAETAYTWCFSLKDEIDSANSASADSATDTAPEDTEFKALFTNVPNGTSVTEVKDMITNVENDGVKIQLKCDPELLESEKNNEEDTNTILVTFEHEKDYKMARRGLESLVMLGIKMRPYHG